MRDKNRLSELLYRNNLTYRELSQKSGISKSTLNKIANFESDPRQSTMVSIARALNMEFVDVFNLDWREKFERK